MNTLLKVNPAKLPAPKLPTTPSMRPDPIPEGLPVIIVPSVYKPLDTPTWKSAKDKPRKKGDNRNGKWWPPEEEEKLKKLYLQGLSDGEIADRLHMDKKRVSKRLYALKRNGMVPRCKARDPRIWKEEEIEQFIRMYSEGRTYEEIAETIGRSIGACQMRACDLAKKGKLKVRQPRAHQ